MDVNLPALGVDGNSPTITYSPMTPEWIGIPEDLLSVGWLPYYTELEYASFSGTLKVGEYQHRTSLDGASLTVSWIGTGISITGILLSNATLSVSLDGVIYDTKTRDYLDEHTLISVSNLEDSHHTLSAISVIPDPTTDMVAFGQVALTYQSGSEQFPPAPIILDSNTIQLEGLWTNQNASYSSKTPGDIAYTTFKGSSVMLEGLSSNETGRYLVELDGVATHMTSKSVFTRPNVLLFFATGLDESVTHNITIVNLEQSALVFNDKGFRTYSSAQYAPSIYASSMISHASPAIPAGTIAAIVLAIILGVLLFVLLAIWRFVYYPRRQRYLLRQASTIPGNTPNTHKKSKRGSGMSGFARWRADLENGLAGLGTSVGITFSKSPSPPTEGEIHFDDEDIEARKDLEFTTPAYRSSTSNEHWVNTLSSDSPWSHNASNGERASNMAGSRESSLSDFVAAPATPPQTARKSRRHRSHALPSWISLPMRTKSFTDEIMLDSAAMQAALRDLSPRVSESACLPKIADSIAVGSFFNPDTELAKVRESFQTQHLPGVSHVRFDSSAQTKGVLRHSTNPLNQISGGHHPRSLSFLDLDVSSTNSSASQSRHTSGLPSITGGSPVPHSKQGSSTSSETFPFPTNLSSSQHHPHGHRSQDYLFAGHRFPLKSPEHATSDLPFPSSAVALLDPYFERDVYPPEPTPAHPPLPYHPFGSRTP